MEKKGLFIIYIIIYLLIIDIYIFIANNLEPIIITTPELRDGQFTILGILLGFITCNYIAQKSFPENKPYIKTVGSGQS